jgi:hypothetical protein
MLKRRVRGGTEYWVREFNRIDGRKADEHIGTVAAVSAEQLETVRTAIKLARALVSGSSALRLFGYQRVERRVAAVLAALFSHGLFKAGLTWSARTPMDRSSTSSGSRRRPTRRRTSTLRAANRSSSAYLPSRHSRRFSPTLACSSSRCPGCRHGGLPGPSRFRAPMRCLWTSSPPARRSAISCRCRSSVLMRSKFPCWISWSRSRSRPSRLDRTMSSRSRCRRPSASCSTSSFRHKKEGAIARRRARTSSRRRRSPRRWQKTARMRLRPRSTTCRPRRARRPGAVPKPEPGYSKVLTLPGAKVSNR